MGYTLCNNHNSLVPYIMFCPSCLLHIQYNTFPAASTNCCTAALGFLDDDIIPIFLNRFHTECTWKPLHSNATKKVLPPIPSTWLWWAPKCQNLVQFVPTVIEYLARALYRTSTEIKTKFRIWSFPISLIIQYCVVEVCGSSNLIQLSIHADRVQLHLISEHLQHPFWPLLEQYRLDPELLCLWFAREFSL